MGGVPLPVSGTEGMSTKRGLPSRSVVTAEGTAALFPASMAGGGELQAQVVVGGAGGVVCAVGILKEWVSIHVVTA